MTTGNRETRPRQTTPFWQLSVANAQQGVIVCSESRGNCDFEVFKIALSLYVSLGFEGLADAVRWYDRGGDLASPVDRAQGDMLAYGLSMKVLAESLDVVILG